MLVAARSAARAAARRQRSPPWLPPGPACAAAATRVDDEQRRLFHSTQKKEVLPFIAAGIGIALAATGLRYLIRAGQRMKDMEKEEREAAAARAAAGPDPNIDAAGMGAAAAAMGVGAVSGPAFGLDFGTTSMRLAVCSAEGKGPEVVENKEGSRWTPAVVSYGMTTGEAVVGQLAKAQRWQAPQSTILGLQPALGLKFGAPAVEHLAARVKYPLVDASGQLCVEVAGVPMPVGRIAGDMLANMAQLKDHKVGPGGAVVLSAPAHFDEAQRKALAEAGTAAGLVVAGTVQEPVAAAAAALDAGLLPEEARSGLVAVVDMGGRCLSCSLVDLGGEDGATGGKLVACSSSNELGGEYIEELMVAEMNSDFKSKNKGLDLLGDPLSLTRLYEAAEAAKVALSKSQTTTINLPFITADATGPKHLDMDLSRAQFERAVDPHMARAAQPCEAALQQAGVGAGSVKAVLLVGGCSRIPAVQALAARVFGQPPIVATHSEELVLLGATLAARREVYGS